MLIGYTVMRIVTGAFPVPRPGIQDFALGQYGPFFFTNIVHVHSVFAIAITLHGEIGGGLAIRDGALCSAGCGCCDGLYGPRRFLSRHSRLFPEWGRL